MKFTTTLAAVVLVTVATALPAGNMDVSKQGVETSSTCPHYTLINTRGTGTPQGQCWNFENLNNNVMSKLSGGIAHATIYPASQDQHSWIGSHHMINHIKEILSWHPDECFILEGYSQGAAATTNALKNITGSAIDAVKGVLLFGNPNHKAGLACNVDSTGGKTTENCNGSGIHAGGIPDEWVSKSLDVCALGDGVCDPPATGWVINAQHQSYAESASVQAMAQEFVLKQLA